MVLAKKIKILLIVMISIIVVAATVIPVVVVLVKRNNPPPVVDDGPLVITEVASLSLTNNFGLKWYSAIDRENDRLFISCEQTFWLYDISTPEDPKLLDVPSGHVGHMFYHNGYLYAKKLDYIDGSYFQTGYLQIFSTTGDKLVLLGSVYDSFFYQSREFFVDAERNLLFTSGKELILWDISNPAHPVLKSKFQYSSISFETYDFYSEGIAFHPTEPMLLVSLHTQNFLLFDYSNTSDLQRIYMEHDTGAVDLTRNRNNFRLVSRGAYPLFMHEWRKLCVINWTDAQKPVVLEGFLLLSEEWGVDLFPIESDRLLFNGKVEGLLNVSQCSNFTYISQVYPLSECRIGVGLPPLLHFPYIYTIHSDSNGMLLKVLKVG